MSVDPSNSVSIAYAHERHIGAGDSRTTLEDASEATPVRLADGQMVTLGMIADGMGGMEGGEIASRTAIETALSFLSQGSPTNLPALMQGALLDAQQRVLARSKELGFSRMGTTATMAIVSPDGHLYLAHVGDSRAYLIRRSEITQLTLDHVWGDEQVRQGKLTPEEAAIHDRRDSLNRYIGQNRTLAVDMGIWLQGGRESQAEAEARQGFALRPGDTVVLCSDGLVKERPYSTRHYVEPDEIVQIVGSMTPYDAARRLVNLAVERSVDDNVSVAILHVQSQGGYGEVVSPTVAPGAESSIKRDAIVRHLMGDGDLDFDQLASPEPVTSIPPFTPELPTEPDHSSRSRGSRSAPRSEESRKRLGGFRAVLLLLLILAAIVILVVLVAGFILPGQRTSGVPQPGNIAAAVRTDIRVSQASGTIQYSTGGDPIGVQQGDTLPADTHLVLTIDSGGRVRLDLPDGTFLYAGDESTEFWLTPNPAAGQGAAPDTMVRLISGRLLVDATNRGGFTLYTPNENPWVELLGTTMGAHRVVDRAAGIEEVTLECLDGRCTLIEQELEIGPCQRVEITGSGVSVPAGITTDTWSPLVGAGLGSSALCGG